MNAATTSSLSEGFWEPKRAMTLSAARRHTRFIRVFRYALLAAALIMIAVLSYFIFDRPDLTKGPTQLSGEGVRMTNPRYTGVDESGLPYSLTADYAIRDLDSAAVVNLVNPVLSFSQTADGESSRIVAEEGTYDSRAQTMELRSDVVVRTQQGHVCHTSHALIYAREKTVRGNEPISCEGDFGTMRGDRYEILDNYTRFVFNTNFTALLLSPEGNDASDDLTPQEETP